MHAIYRPAYTYTDLCCIYSLLASLIQTTTDDNSSDDRYPKYCTAVRRVVKHLISNGLLDRRSQENMLLMLNLYPDNLTGWPVRAHRNALFVLLTIVLNWQTKPDWTEKQVDTIMLL